MHHMVHGTVHVVHAMVYKSSFILLCGERCGKGLMHCMMWHVACGMWHDVASTLELASNREVPWYHHEYNNQQYCTLVCADKKIASY